MLRPPIELPFFSNDGLPIFVFNWSFRSSIFTAQPGDIMQLLHVSTASGFFCILCQAIDVELFVCLDVSLEPFVGICILFSFPCLFRSGAIVVHYAFLLPPLLDLLFQRFQRYFVTSKTKFWWTSIKCIHDNGRVHFVVSVLRPCLIVVGS